MDVRIGVTDHPREITVRLADDTDRSAVRAEIASAMSGGSDILWLTDDKGTEVGVVASRIAFVEIGPEGAGRIGFG